ncbi:disulfide bond formation protein B [Nocardia sp. NPDC051832]|uniref:disulfide bond formation protein B n=1 Tax=Nocardia sp. NPDC051832 TaxID=3155673 RepID=UPI003428F183
MTESESTGRHHRVVTETVVTETVVPERAAGFAGQLQYWLACIFVVGWTGVICGGLAVQFGTWDYPCPLCMLQRIFMAMAALGAAIIVRKGMLGIITARDYMTGWGLALLGCVAGGFTAWRQTMLHINDWQKPNGPVGYGGAVLGLHLYVWAWVLFVAAVFAIGLVLCFGYYTAASSFSPTAGHRLIGQFALWFLGLVLVINMVAVFCLAGLHWFLPDNPDKYRLFYDLGIL